jgi:queuine tRNA-ribosyltransferase
VSVNFALTSQPDSPVQARTGILSTPHGDVTTPAFMPVGTLATVKALTPQDVAATGAGMLLVNAYHLYLRPGHSLIEGLGGVHRFMGWDGPILSDSGGFQVFSLAKLLKIDEAGVRFRSHIDGSEHFYTPELAMEVQRALGVDIAMPLDHVIPGDADEATAKDAMERTTRWLGRCRAATGGTALFPIVQGGGHEDLRLAHAKELVDLDAPGFAIGGLSVGESKAEQWAMTELVAAELPADRPRYLMGVGSPEDLVEGVARGVDMFDCVLPTRLGRNGGLFTDDGRVSIKSARFRKLDEAVDPGCDCSTCATYSAAYLHHLFRNDELLGYRLATIHNLRYLARLTERMHEAIQPGRFEAFARDFVRRYQPADETVRAEQRKKWSTRRL